MKKIFSYVFLVVQAISAFGFWYYLKYLINQPSWINLVILMVIFTVLMAFEMLTITLNAPKYFIWLSFLAIILGFLTGFAFLPIYLPIFAAALIAFAISVKNLKTDAQKNLKFDFWQISKNSAKSFVVGIALLVAGAVFTFSPKLVMENLGVTQASLNLGLNLTQSVLGTKMPYLSPNLTGQQFALLYILDQSNSQGTADQLGQFLPASIKQEMNAQGIKLSDLVSKPGVAQSNPKILNGLLDLLNKDSAYKTQEKQILDGLGLPQEYAKEPIAVAADKIITKKLTDIWPQYGFIITLVLAVTVFLLLQSFRYLLAIPGLALGGFIFWLLKKYNVLKLTVQKVDKEELSWN